MLTVDKDGKTSAKSGVEYDIWRKLPFSLKSVFLILVLGMMGTLQVRAFK